MTPKTLDDIQDMPTLYIIAAVAHAKRVMTLFRVAEDLNIPLGALHITFDDITAFDMSQIIARRPPDSD